VYIQVQDVSKIRESQEATEGEPNSRCYQACTSLAYKHLLLENLMEVFIPH